MCSFWWMFISILSMGTQPGQSECLVQQQHQHLSGREGEGGGVGREGSRLMMAYGFALKSLCTLFTKCSWEMLEDIYTSMYNAFEGHHVVVSGV